MFDFWYNDFIIVCYHISFLLRFLLKCSLDKSKTLRFRWNSKQAIKKNNQLNSILIFSLTLTKQLRFFEIITIFDNGSRAACCFWIIHNIFKFRITLVFFECITILENGFCAACCNWIEHFIIKLQNHSLYCLSLRRQAIRWPPQSSLDEAIVLMNLANHPVIVNYYCIRTIGKQISCVGLVDLPWKRISGLEFFVVGKNSERVIRRTSPCQTNVVRMTLNQDSECILIISNIGIFGIVYNYRVPHTQQF